MAFEPRLDVLPPAQLRFWQEPNAIPAHFVLYGGTAIALRLGHRSSEDFDFFSAEPLAPKTFLRESGLESGSEILQSSENTLTLRIDRGGPVKVSFFGGLTLGQIAKPDAVASQRFGIASLEDLFAAKLKVVWQRAEAKDYLDIAAILRSGLPLEHGLGCARAVHGENFNPTVALKALTYFEDGDVEQLPSKTKRLLVEAASQVAEIPEVRCFADRISSER